MDKKITYNLTIDGADLNHAVRAFVVASNYICSSTPKKPTIGKESRKLKDLRKKNTKIAMELTKAMNNLLFKCSLDSNENKLD